MISREIIVDSFAGGGGASTGIELALGRSPDIAINHDPEAIAMHAANHPRTRHYLSNVWDVDPREACGGRPVGLMWLSPDCTYFSKARGAKPFRDRNKARRRRGLANLAIRWAKAVRPRVLIMENVEEFEHWCPLLANGLPDWSRIGLNFRRWRRELENLGYRVEIRQLRACDFGAPTTRKRLFVIARCDGQPIRWPTPTHGKGLEAYRTAAECIDWTIPCPSIFGRRKPLAEKTLARIARGLRRYVIEAAEPFLIHRGNGERVGQSPRIYDIHAPHPTVVASGIKTGLVTAFLARHYGGNENDGAPVQLPMHTITTRDHHAAVQVQLGAAREQREEVRAFLMKWYGSERDGAQLGLPIGTITTKDRFGLVTVHGARYVIADIGMRMLTPRELFTAQGFPLSYQIAPKHNGKRLTKTAQVRMCGNSVSPHVAAALVAANAGELAVREAA